MTVEDMPRWKRVASVRVWILGGNSPPTGRAVVHQEMVPVAIDGDEHGPKAVVSGTPR